MKMFPTHRLVNFCATDLDLIGISIGTSSKRRRRTITADRTERRKLNTRVGDRNETENLADGFHLKRTIETRYDNRQFVKMNEFANCLVKVRKELSLVDKDSVDVFDIEPRKGIALDTRRLGVIMTHDRTKSVVPIIAGVINNKHLETKDTKLMILFNKPR